jgi:hypothetical protein
MFRPAAVALITMSCLWAMSAPAAAQEPSLDPPAGLFAKMTAPAGNKWQAPLPVILAARGPVLPSLYASLISLELYDGYSTSHGLANGAVESNTFMGAVTRHPGIMWATKGGAAFASIFVAERLWRQGRRGQALGVMLASNGLMMAVAANNARVLHAQR